MITLVDYGISNISSMQNALSFLGTRYELTSDPVRVLGAKKIVLPGVGAFPKAMIQLHKLGLVSPLREAILKNKTPCLGVCLGMQLLGEFSEENGHTQGLGLIPGSVIHLGILDSNLKIPHVGFNSVEYRMKCPLFEGIKSGSDFYFVHSYSFHCDHLHNLAAFSDYGGSEITAVIQHNNVFGVQFHPEKSQSNGLKLLRNFLHL